MIKIRNLEAGYGGNNVLHIPSLSIMDSQVTSIIGKNGSGKSTLLKSIDSLIDYEGEVLIDGTNVADMRHIKRAKKIAYLPQQLNQVKMSVKTLVSHGRYAHTSSMSHNLSKLDLDKIDSAMELTDVVEYSDRYVDELSGGERSRTYLAMVVAQDSRYILLDEPTSDYDIEHQRMVMDIIVRLAHDGKGVVICTHDIPLALSVSDKVIIIRDDKEVITTTPNEILEDDIQLRESIGVGVALSHRENALYKYQLVK